MRPNMRPEQPKRKKTPKKLRPTSGGSSGSGNNPKVKKSVKKITIQKAKDRRRTREGSKAAGQKRNKMKKKVELKVTNMFNPNMANMEVPDIIRFSSIENNQMGLPFQFGRPQGSPQENYPRLRPIVIDGQNIAVEHAKRTRNCFGFS